MRRIGAVSMDAKRSGGRGRAQSWCRKCGSALHADEVRIVISSQAVGSRSLPIEERLVCGRCFLDSGKKTSPADPEKGAARKGQAVSLLAR